MKLRLRHLYAAFAAAAFVLYAGKASAIPLPPGASRKLDQILRQPEYQPRNRGTWGEIVAKMIESVVQSVKNSVSNILDWLFGGSDGTGRFSLPDWLAGLFFRLGDLLHIAILLGIIYLLYRIIRPLIPRFAGQPAEGAAIQVKKSPGRSKDLAKLFEQERWGDLLIAIRLALRSSLAADYGFPDSATDREIIRSVNQGVGGPAGEDRPAPVNSGLSSLFQGVASAFESAAFAGRNIDEAVISGLYQRFQTTIGTAGRSEE